MTTTEEIEAVAKSLHLSASCVFVPLSKSCNAKDKHPTLNWRVTLKNDLRDIITTDYSQGCGHTPAYKAPVSRLGGYNCVMRDDAVRSECETGRAHYGALAGTGTKLKPPSLAEILSSLVTDASAINYANYEQWAGDMGCYEDSRKGEAIYRACLEIGLTLRSALGDRGLEALQDVCQNY